jgi:hypothetical protein
MIPGRKMIQESYDDLLDGKIDDLQLAKKEEAFKKRTETNIIVEKFLKENPNINIEYVIDCFKSNMLSTNACCIKLGISPAAFSRLKKKYGISPAYVAKKSESSLYKIPPKLPNKARKNYYTTEQIKKISPEDISLIQLRAARSLRFPNGIDKPIKWTPRGRHENGKLKARTNILQKLGIRVHYSPDVNKYMVDGKGIRGFFSKKEVDNFNIRFGKLTAFD